jgi:hypothetical protein
MRSTTISVAIIALALSLTSGCIISDGDSSFTIDNESSYVLVAVYIAEVGDPTWGPNLIPEALYPGDSLVITDIECGDYDVLVTDETGVDCELGNIDLCFDDDGWTVTDVTLDVCAFSPLR